VLQSPNTAQREQNRFKLLIYDQETFKVISLFKIGDLRERFVGDHVDIQSDKEEMLGVDAVYFVEPSRKNLDIVLYDLNQRYFDSFFLCFSHYCSSEDLQYFFENAIRIQRVNLIKEIQEFNFSSFPLGTGISCLGSKGSKKLFALKTLSELTQQDSLPLIVFDKGDLEVQEIIRFIQEEISKDYFHQKTKEKLVDETQVLFVFSN
jgi:hypothetical protein